MPERKHGRAFWIASAVIATAIQFAVLLWLGAPPWAAFGLAYLGYQMFALGDRLRGRR